VDTTLKRLSDWFAAQADGDYEHDHGVRIETLDNPGWRVRVELTGTPLELAVFPEYQDSYDDEARWLRCWRADNVFEAACGVPRLEDAVLVFLDWAASVDVPAPS